MAKKMRLFIPHSVEGIDMPEELQRLAESVVSEQDMILVGVTSIVHKDGWAEGPARSGWLLDCDVEEVAV